MTLHKAICGLVDLAVLHGPDAELRVLLREHPDDRSLVECTVSRVAEADLTMDSFPSLVVEPSVCASEVYSC